MQYCIFNSGFYQLKLYCGTAKASNMAVFPNDTVFLLNTLFTWYPFSFGYVFIFSVGEPGTLTVW